MKKMNIAIISGTCYNACRLKDNNDEHYERLKRKPQCCNTGVFYSFFGMAAYFHRLVTDYTSLSNHLQIRWLTKSARTLMIKDKYEF
ncbi:MAG: hypothetical protein LIO96_13870, partial [Lachnospiraceae bacterium]|nr:hypothetical protein [Lachnospiraceae bacterium]